MSFRRVLSYNPHNYHCNIVDPFWLYRYTWLSRGCGDVVTLAGYPTQLTQKVYSISYCHRRLVLKWYARCKCKLWFHGTVKLVYSQNGKSAWRNVFGRWSQMSRGNEITFKRLCEAAVFLQKCLEKNVFERDCGGFRWKSAGTFLRQKPEWVWLVLGYRRQYVQISYTEVSHAFSLVLSSHLPTNSFLLSASTCQSS